MKNYSVVLNVFIIALLGFSLQLSSCKKDDDDSGNPLPSSGVNIKTTVTGKVTDTNNNIVIGVTVVLGTKTTITDSRGHFLFENTFVPKDRLVIKGNKQGYFESIKGKKTQTRGVNYMNLVMEELPAAVNISGVSGGVVNIPGGASITFPANAFTDANGNAYTGMVKIYSRHFNPASPGFANIIPGGDLLGINALGQPRSLYTLGMIEALLKDNSGLNEIKLADGISAQLKFPIDPSQSSEAQATIPLWYLNETTGIWKEEGQAIKNGNFFEGNVSHFSTWNVDYMEERTDIVGLVVDCQGNPMANVVVTINGFMNVVTDNAGNYSTWVPLGFVINCQVLALYNPTIPTNSAVQTITATSGLNVVPAIAIPCNTRIIGTINACGTNNPVSGFVYVSWNGGNSYQYSDNGSYDMAMPVATTVIITVFKNSLSDSKVFMTGAALTTEIVPQFQLCTESTPAENTFRVDAGGNSISYEMIVDENMSNVFFHFDSNGSIEIIDLDLNGICLPGLYDANINMHLSQSTDGFSFNIDTNALNNSIFIQLTNSSNSYFFESGQNFTHTLNKVVITDFGSPGGYLTGNFEYDSSQGIISMGRFSVRRTD